MGLAYVVGTHDTKGAEAALVRAAGAQVVSVDVSTQDPDTQGRGRHRRLPPGLITGGSIGAETAKTLDDCVALIDEWSAAAFEVREDTLVLCHGFYGASSMERLPTETALTEQTRAFKTRLSRR